MIRISPELAIFVLGVLAVLATFQRIPEVQVRSRWIRALFFTGVLVQVLTHWFQYSYAVTNRLEGQRAIERSTAMSLFAYTTNDVALLKATTDDAFLVGYRLFRNNEPEAAAAFFSQAIARGRFVAPSHYVLAYLTSHDKDRRLDPQRDWTVPVEHISKALSHDPEYAPAYYLRAKLEAASNQAKAALRDLRIAVMAPRVGLIPCYDVNRKEEVERSWARLSGDAEFSELQRQCREVHGAALQAMK